MATPQAAVSPPIVQDPKKAKIEPEQEPNHQVDPETSLDVDSGDEADYVPTPVKSLTNSLDAVATPTPQKMMSSCDRKKVPCLDILERTPTPNPVMRNFNLKWDCKTCTSNPRCWKKMPKNHKMFRIVGRMRKMVSRAS